MIKIELKNDLRIMSLQHSNYRRVSTVLKTMSRFLFTARGAKGGHRKGPRDGAQLWPLLRCNHREHGSGPGFQRAAQADRQAGH